MQEIRTKTAADIVLEEKKQKVDDMQKFKNKQIACRNEE